VIGSLLPRTRDRAGRREGRRSAGQETGGQEKLKSGKLGAGRNIIGDEWRVTFDAFKAGKRLKD
jgi:hypothetical protein